jgi:hypothetical protein
MRFERPALADGSDKAGPFDTAATSTPASLDASLGLERSTAADHSERLTEALPEPKR